MKVQLYIKKNYLGFFVSQLELFLQVHDQSNSYSFVEFLMGKVGHIVLFLPEINQLINRVKKSYKSEWSNKREEIDKIFEKYVVDQ